MNGDSCDFCEYFDIWTLLRVLGSYRTWSCRQVNHDVICWTLLLKTLKLWWCHFAAVNSTLPVNEHEWYNVHGEEAHTTSLWAATMWNEQWGNSNRFSSRACDATRSNWINNKRRKLLRPQLNAQGPSAVRGPMAADVGPVALGALGKGTNSI